jgi:hypothetical protein
VSTFTRTPPFTHADLRRAIRPGTEITRTSSLLPTATVTVTRVTTKGWYHAHTVHVLGKDRTVRGYTPWGPAAATTVHGDAPWRWDVDYRHGSVHYEATNAPPRRLPGEPRPARETTPA